MNPGIVEGDIYQAPGIPYPPIEPPFTAKTSGPDDCRNASPFKVSSSPNIYAFTSNTANQNNLGDCTLTGSETLQLRVPIGTTAPANFFLNKITEMGTANIQVTDLAGNLCPPATDPPATLCAPVQLYVKDTLNLSGAGIQAGVPGDPTRFSIFYDGTADATYSGTADFWGTIYAPNAKLRLIGTVTIYGAVTAQDITANGNVTLHYDLDLARMRVSITPFRVVNQTRSVF